MQKHILISLFLFISQPVLAANWLLEKASIDYLVVHPLHKVTGVSTAAKGKGQCTKTGCEFLVATPVASFDSHNSNRDSHVQQVVGAGTHPFVSVSLKSTSDVFSKNTPMAAEIELNGVKVSKQIEVSIDKNETSATASGKIHLLLSEFKIERPSLLGVSVKDDFEINFESQWLYK